MQAVLDDDDERPQVQILARGFQGFVQVRM